MGKFCTIRLSSENVLIKKLRKILPYELDSLNVSVPVPVDDLKLSVTGSSVGRLVVKTGSVSVSHQKSVITDTILVFIPISAVEIWVAIVCLLQFEYDTSH